MTKLAGWFWLVLVSTAGFAMFAVKYEVQSLEEELNRARKEVAAEEHAIRMDEVEWAYLTRPQTLEELNRRHLSLMPIATAQIRTALPDIPMRPPPPPPVEEAMAAAAPPIAEATPSDASPPKTAQETAPAMAAPGQASFVVATAPQATAPNVAAPPQTTTRASLTVAPTQTMSPIAATAQIPTRAPEIPKPVVIKAAAKPAALRRPKTLDDLIAQIVASR
jgi:hypothetical protein